MSDFENLINECKSKEEIQAIYNMYIMISCLNKHDRFRKVYIYNNKN